MPEEEPTLRDQLRCALQREAALREELRSREELLQDAEHLRRLVDCCPDYIYLQDLELRFSWTNWPGSPAGNVDLLGKTDFDYLSLGEAQYLTAVKRKVLETGIGTRAELSRLVGGEDRYFEAAFEPARSREGVTLGLFGYVRDITARKRAEGELRALKDRMAVELAGMRRFHKITETFMLGGDLSVLIEDVLDGAIAVTGADKGSFQLVDDSGELKIVAQRGFKQSTLDFFKGSYAGEAACDVALQRAEPVVVDDVAQSPIFAGSPAVDVLVAAGVRAIRATPILDRFGRVLGVLSTHYRDPLRPDQRDQRILDMLAQQTGYSIEHRRAEEERERLVEQLEKANERLMRSELDARRAAAEARKQALQMAAVLKSMVSAVLVIDAAGNVVVCNEAAQTLTGVPNEALQNIYGDESVRLFYSDGRQVPSECRPAAKLLAGEEVQDEEYLMERYDGTRCTVICSGSAVCDEQGKVALAILVSRDVTELRHVEQMREEYVSMISHDLRSPLTTIIGLADWLKRLLKQKGMEREGARVDTMLKSARRMNSMIQELVESARFESTALKLTREPIDLVRLVSDLVGRIGTLDDRKRIKLDKASHSLVGSVDQDHIERAIANLVTNALKYSPADKPVVIRLEEQDGKALISVSDEGVGIPTEDLPHIFERHYRAKTVAWHEGLGLGLYIARLIADAHGGQIWAKSRLGQGSAFHLVLPLV